MSWEAFDQRVWPLTDPRKPSGPGNPPDPNKNPPHIKHLPKHLKGMMMCRLDNTVLAVGGDGSDAQQSFILTLILGNLEMFPTRIDLVGRPASIEEDPADDWCGIVVDRGDTKIAVAMTNSRFPEFKPCALARQAAEWALSAR